MITGTPGARASLHVSPASTRPVTWIPLATSATGARALATVRDLARAVPLHLARYDDGTLDTSFGAGASGAALFLHYAAVATGDDEAHAECVELLGRALDGLHAMPGAGLFGGYAGVAWTISHLQQRGVEELDEVNLAEMDAVIEAVLRNVPWPGDYDLISGLVGLGVYGLERMHQGAGEEIVAATVDRLSETAEWMDDGAAWFHPPWLLAPHFREKHPEGWYNLGLAHGIPGVLAFLGHAVSCDVRGTTARRLLVAGARWIRGQVRFDKIGDAWLSYHVDPAAPGAARERARDAWCYGAPGASVALLGAARAVGDELLEVAALALARTAARHDLSGTAVRDASYCHGASGLAHLYARLHMATGEPAFADVARRWTDHTLSFRVPGAGVAGFSYYSGRGEQPAWVADSNFLEGASGIGLVLLAMCSSTSPAWDRVLLASASPAGETGARTDLPGTTNRPPINDRPLRPAIK